MSAAPERTFRSALVAAELRAQRENDRREERGICAGLSRTIVSTLFPYTTLFRSSHVVSCTHSRPQPPTHFLPSAASSPSHLTALHAKHLPPPPTVRSARHTSPQNGGPKGKMIEGRSGGSGRGTRRELWAPPDSGP